MRSNQLSYASINIVYYSIIQKQKQALPILYINLFSRIHYYKSRTVVQEDAAASDTAAQTAPDAANDAQTDATAAEPQQTTARAGVTEEENNDAMLVQ